ncbi:MAG: holin [Lachnospiraceae bacterium]|nr:holin [Lachnospiraceae bacterium]
MKNKQYWIEWTKKAGIRAAKTFAQTAVSMMTVGQAVMDVNWVNVLSVSCVAAVISLGTSVAGLPEVHTEDTDDE